MQVLEPLLLPARRAQPALALGGRGAHAAPTLALTTDLKETLPRKHGFSLDEMSASVKVARMTRTIHVTKADIERGSPKSEICCPIALALRREMNCAKLDVYVGKVRGNVKGSDFELPTRATTFIHRFDAGKPVRPFRFVLKLK